MTNRKRTVSRNRLYLAAGVLPALAACTSSPGDGAERTSQGATTNLTATFETSVSRQFVAADNGGGAGITANRSVALAWETFSVVDINGGALTSGDLVYLQANDGHYWQAFDGGGGNLNAASGNRMDWETFRVVKPGGAGVIASGDAVGLQTSGGKWVSALNGGGSALTASGAAMSTWETFTIGLGGAGAISGSGAATTPSAPTPSGTEAAPAGYKLAWSDEFNGPDGSPIDSSKWKFDTGNSGWGNNELENYTDRTRNVEQRGGNLAIHVIKEDFGGAPYTSGRINTAGKFSATFGRVEARIKVPTGQGIWPAFWMLGDNIGTTPWPACGEIDIMENIGSTPATVYGTLHGAVSGGGGKGGAMTLPNGKFADAFHVFAVEWSAGEIMFFVDGNNYQTQTRNTLASGDWAFDHSFFLLLNVAVGGNWPGYPNDSTPFPQDMLVDYVRVYQR